MVYLSIKLSKYINSRMHITFYPYAKSSFLPCRCIRCDIHTYKYKIYMRLRWPCPMMMIMMMNIGDSSYIYIYISFENITLVWLCPIMKPTHSRRDWVLYLGKDPDNVADATHYPETTTPHEAHWLGHIMSTPFCPMKWDEQSLSL